MLKDLFYQKYLPLVDLGPKIPLLQIQVFEFKFPEASSNSKGWTLTHYTISILKWIHTKSFSKVYYS